MSNPFDPPSSASYQPPPPTGQGDATGGIIPYKNPKALIAYYVGIGSLLCCFVGLPVGIVAVVLGIMGLRDHARNPVISGTVHAWIGIVLGTISTLAAIPFAIAIIAAIANGGR
jgi:hypothetical protein